MPSNIRNEQSYIQPYKRVIEEGCAMLDGMSGQQSFPIFHHIQIFCLLLYEKVIKISLYFEFLPPMFLY